MTESTDRLDSTKLNSVESASTNIADKKVPIAVSSTHQSIDSKTIKHTPKAMYVTSGNSITPKGKLDKMPKMVANGSRAFIWYLLAIMVLILDQWTKWLAQTKLAFNDPVPVIEPFLNWTLAYNYGAAFSFLADAGGWQKWFFSGLALMMRKPSKT